MTKKEHDLINFIHDLYNIEISSLIPASGNTSFLQKIKLLKEQKFLQPHYFKELLKEVHKEQCIILTDCIHMHLILFQINEDIYAAGPFFSLYFTEIDCRKILQTLKIDSISSSILLDYFNRYPQISETDALHIVTTLIKQICHITEINVKEINDERIYSMDDSFSHQKKINYTMSLTEHYQVEKTFMHDIEEGKVADALKKFNKMSSNVAPLISLGTTLENERISAAILRTTIRIAAENAGMPAVVIDQLSSRSSAAVRAATKPEEIRLEKTKLIEVFCNEIQQEKKKKYSNLTITAINTMERMYSQGITIQQLADELNTSTHTLDRIFHAETNQTPSAYLLDIRMGNAQLLLANTDIAIQDISNRIGIFDANYFVKIFRRKFHVTPSQYRKIHRL